MPTEDDGLLHLTDDGTLGGFVALRETFLVLASPGWDDDYDKDYDYEANEVDWA